MKATKAQILAAAKDFCERNPENTISESDNGRIRLFEGSPKPGDIELWEENGELRCSNPDFGMIFSEYIHDLEKPPQQPTQQSPGTSLVTAEEQKKIAQLKENHITSRSQDPDLKQFHQKKSRMYDTEDGQAPTAAMVSREANKHRLCTEIKEFTVTDDLVRAHVRVTDPATGQFKEDGVAFTRSAFVAKKTIDIVNKHIKKNPGLVVDVDPITMRPILAPDVQIYGVPAPLFVAKEVLKSWNFLGRFAVTTAERRCQDKLLNAEFREREEIELEAQEMADVAEGA